MADLIFQKVAPAHQRAGGLRRRRPLQRDPPKCPSRLPLLTAAGRTVRVLREGESIRTYPLLSATTREFNRFRSQ